MASEPKPTNPSGGLQIVTVLFLVWALMFYLARIWSKVSKRDRWGSDGTVVSLAMLAAIAHVVAIYYASDHGYGQGWHDHLDASRRATVEKALYTAQIFFVLSMNLTRISTALFTARILNLGKRHKHMAPAIISACGVLTLVLVLIMAIRSPVAEPWTSLEGSQEMFVRWVVVEVLGLVIDSSTLIFLVIVVWGIQMSVSKRLSVSALFAVRLLIVPVVAYRLFKLRPSASEQSSGYYDNATAILTEAELQLFLVLTSATCLKPLFQPFHAGEFTAKGSDIAVTGYSNRVGGKGRSEAYYELSGGPTSGSRGEKDRKQPQVVTSVASVTKDDASDEMDLIQPHNFHAPTAARLRGDDTENWTEAVAGPTAHLHTRNGRDRIEATRTVTVSYEDRDV